MKHRNPFAVFFLYYITLSIYLLYWFVKTKEEMNKRGEHIPTAWLLIIPLISLWWLWLYSKGVGHVTEDRMNGIVAFILLVFLGPIGAAIIQDSFNTVAEITPLHAPPSSPNAPVATSPTPVNQAPTVNPTPTTVTPSSPTPPTTPPVVSG